MITIKDLSIEGDIVLAPMAGFTDPPFRRIARRHGAALVFTELISAVGIVRNSLKTMDLLRFSEEERPIAIQIFGNNPDTMGEAAAILTGLKPDIIDINMGCCAQKVCKNGSGAALLRDAGLLGAIASGVVRSAGIPVSAKIRIGWDFSSLNYMDTVKILEDSGISLISVHGRTRSQKYGERADWGVIKEICEKSNLPIIGNGDIASHEEACSRLRESGCAAVMVGRGAIGNPWIFSGRTPARHELVEQIKSHLASMIEYYGEYGIVLMRKHMVRYIRGFRNAAGMRASLLRSTDIGEIHRILESLEE
jgi:tRNA-dihydrouridine synthase B